MSSWQSFGHMATPWLGEAEQNALTVLPRLHILGEGLFSKRKLGCCYQKKEKGRGVKKEKCPPEFSSSLVSLWFWHQVELPPYGNYLLPLNPTFLPPHYSFSAFSSSSLVFPRPLFLASFSSLFTGFSTYSSLQWPPACLRLLNPELYRYDRLNGQYPLDIPRVTYCSSFCHLALPSACFHSREWHHGPLTQASKPETVWCFSLSLPKSIQSPNSANRVSSISPKGLLSFAFPILLPWFRFSSSYLDDSLPAGDPVSSFTPFQPIFRMASREIVLKKQIWPGLSPWLKPTEESPNSLIREKALQSPLYFSRFMSTWFIPEHKHQFSNFHELCSCCTFSLK